VLSKVVLTDYVADHYSKLVDQHIFSSSAGYESNSQIFQTTWPLCSTAGCCDCTALVPPAEETVKRAYKKGSVSECPGTSLEAKVAVCYERRSIGLSLLLRSDAECSTVSE
jgi:hypothetical protein